VGNIGVQREMRERGDELDAGIKRRDVLPDAAEPVVDEGPPLSECRGIPLATSCTRNDMKAGKGSNHNDHFIVRALSSHETVYSQDRFRSGSCNERRILVWCVLHL